MKFWKMNGAGNDFIILNNLTEHLPVSSLPGLALALGLEGRAQLERLAAGGDKTASVLRRALSRVEEANLQSLYQKDTASSAKFLLQSCFGYAERPAPAAPGDITVSIVEDEA